MSISDQKSRIKLGRKKWIWDPLHEVATYKMILFFWALLVPEYILAWAVRQYLQAGVISKQVPGCTRTHGFFMIMGGFHLYHLPPDTPSVPLTLKSTEPSGFIIPTGYYSCVEEVPVCPLQINDVPAEILEFVSPNETQLKDRGKSDALTKFIILIQTLWFVIQCIARGSQRLPLTELEVVTLAYAILNLFIYAFWWAKPRNVECPIRLYKLPSSDHEEPEPKTEGRRRLEEHRAYRALVWLVKLFGYTVGSQDQLVTISAQRSIPMFWSGQLNSSLTSMAGFGPSVLGAVFGAIHCIVWSSEFPSNAELVTWRISCVAMIVVPLLVAAVCAVAIIAIRRPDEEETPVWTAVIGAVFYLSLALTAWVYVASRIATLIITFTTLRSLSPAALTTVDWTTFIPHL
ncbi:hypothetical protein M408DRAFT_28065 [Serendipita vermifera MAFF 305830]|uniref:Uncharacterized protein n=1 Tax=Serendipita vermifera MAFF 305830 TaxID=933852 RepID=A0A0C3AF46_SERVB|nr:hypothetical protein M408DRAFT_28065 [Serendipita vermifera MAFF 305830]